MDTRKIKIVHFIDPKFYYLTFAIIGFASFYILFYLNLPWPKISSRLVYNYMYYFYVLDNNNMKNLYKEENFFVVIL